MFVLNSTTSGNYVNNSDYLENMLDVNAWYYRAIPIANVMSNAATFEVNWLACKWYLDNFLKNPSASDWSDWDFVNVFFPTTTATAVYLVSSSTLKPDIIMWKKIYSQVPYQNNNYYNQYNNAHLNLLDIEYFILWSDWVLTSFWLIASHMTNWTVTTWWVIQFTWNRIIEYDWAWIITKTWDRIVMKITWKCAWGNVSTAYYWGATWNKSWNSFSPTLISTETISS